MGDDAMDVRQAARYVGRTPETVRRWVWAGRVSATRSGTRLLVQRADLDALLGRGAVLTLGQWVATLPNGTPGGTSAANLVLADREDRDAADAGR